MEDGTVKILNVARKFEEIVIIGTMVLILFIIFFQATSRYLLGSGLIWGDELARYVHVAQIWLGASLAIKSGGHIRITLIRDLFKEKGRKYLDLFATIIFFFFMVFVAVKGTEFIFHLIETGQRAPSLGILMAIPYTVVPLGGFLMVIRLIQQFKMILKGELLDEGIEGVDQ